MNYTFSFFCLILLLTVACNSQKDETQNIPWLVEAGAASVKGNENFKVIELDSFSGAKYEIKGITNENEYFFFNNYNQSIYVYDLKSEPQKPKHIIKVPLDESINFNLVSDLFYHNADSIFIWDDNNSFGDRPELFLINSQGEVVDTFKVSDGNEGYPSKATTSETAIGQSMIYHDGKIILLSSITKYTKEENWYPIILFDLASRSTSLHGTYPQSFYIGKFGFRRWMSNFCLVPELNQVVVSFPYEPNLLYLNLEDTSWNELGFHSDLVATPRPFDETRQTSLEHLLSNSWYLGLSYDKANQLIWRTAEVSKESSPPYSGRGEFQSFLINPRSLKYWVLPGVDWLKTTFYHTTDGPYQMVQKHEELGLAPEDFVIFNPLTLEIVDLETEN